MVNYNETQTLSRLLGTDPVSDVSHPVAVRRFVRHIAATVKWTQRFVVTTSQVTTKSGERTYTLTFDQPDADGTFVLVTVHHHHPVHNGKELTSQKLIIHSSLHLDGRMVDHHVADTSDRSQQIWSMTHLTKSLGVAVQSVPARHNL